MANFEKQVGFAGLARPPLVNGGPPVLPSQVLDAVLQSLSQPPYVETRVLAVDSDSRVLARLRELLEPRLIRFTALDDPLQFWDVLEATLPDLLLLDVDLPQISGIDLCRVVRSDPSWSRLSGGVPLGIHRRRYHCEGLCCGWGPAKCRWAVRTEDPGRHQRRHGHRHAEHALAAVMWTPILVHWRPGCRCRRELANGIGPVPALIDS